MTTSTAAFGLGPVRVMAAHELVLDQIRTAINLGRFRPGDRLPSERDLAAMLHVSRTTVREAVSLLEREGIVAVRRGRGGGIVVQETVRSPAEFKRLIRANRDEIRDVFDFRIAVESAAARLAAERRTKQDIDTMRRLADLMATVISEEVPDSEPAQVARFQDADSRFHMAIARASRSRRLIEAVLSARSSMFLPVGAIFAKLDPSSNDLHFSVMDAIVDRDGDEAAQMIIKHIDSTRRYIEDLL